MKLSVLEMILTFFNSRFMHERLCAHAESVAFFGGGAREKAVSIPTLQYLNVFSIMLSLFEKL